MNNLKLQVTTVERSVTAAFVNRSNNILNSNAHQAGPEFLQQGQREMVVMQQHTSGNLHKGKLPILPHMLNTNQIGATLFTVVPGLLP